MLIADVSDGVAFNKIKKAITAAGATVNIVAPKVGHVKLSDGLTVVVDGQLAGTPSVIFDAVVVLLSGKGARHCR